LIVFIFDSYVIPPKSLTIFLFNHSNAPGLAARASRRADIGELFRTKEVIEERYEIRCEEVPVRVSAGVTTMVRISVPTRYQSMDPIAASWRLDSQPPSYTDITM